jgi:hypothetical protein
VGVFKIVALGGGPVRQVEIYGSVAAWDDLMMLEI